MNRSIIFEKAVKLALIESRKTHFDEPDTPLKNVLAFHGLTSLVHLYESGDDTSISASNRRDLKAEHIAVTIWEQNHAAFLEAVVEKLKSAGITPVFFKGTAMAYAHYEYPASRLRGDTDMIVSPEDYGKAAQVLLADGWSSIPSQGHKIMSWQKSFSRRDKSGFLHEIDLHRELTLCSQVSSLLSYANLFERSMKINMGNTKLNIVSNVDGLIITCFHRLLHRNCDYRTDVMVTRSPDRLIWMLDIHLLASALNPQEWRALINTVMQNGLSQSCLLGLSQAQRIFKAKIPVTVIESLSTGTTSEIDVFLDSQGKKRLLIKFRSLKSWGDRMAMLRELLFPNSSYMTYNYGEDSWLPILYIRRLLRAIQKKPLP